MSTENVAACIVLYNPDLSRLNENINAIYPQVDTLFLVDNGSRNYAEIVTEYEKQRKVQFINLAHNCGIAYALNQACKEAFTNGYEWIVTLDQDSVVQDGLINRYLKFSVEHKDLIGQLTCNIVDRNQKKHTTKTDSFYEVEWCITSGSCVKLSAWENVGGFDEKMFIDGVDTDFGLALNSKGYKTIHINFDGLLHEVGRVSKVLRFLGTEHPIYNHNSTRRYYITRNSIYLARKYKQISMEKTIIKIIGRITIVFLFEDDKLGKLVACTKGIRDGFSL